MTTTVASRRAVQAAKAMTTTTTMTTMTTIRTMMGVTVLWLLFAACTQHNNVGTWTPGGSGGADGGPPMDLGGAAGAAGGGAGAGVTAGTGGAAGAPAGGGGGSGAMTGAGGAAGVGPSGAAGDGGPATDVGPPFVISGCPLYPALLLGDAPPDRLRLGTDAVISTGEHDCAYQAGMPVALPLEPGDGASLLFHYDVNGDGVDDLFFGDATVEQPGTARNALVLLTSLVLDAPTDRVLAYSRRACGDSGAIDPHRVFFLRDLNGDGVPDFVVGTGSTVDAWLNLPGRQAGVLHYEFPASAGRQVALLDVAVGDFDHDGANDVAIGYDWYKGLPPSGSDPGFELGVMVFRGRPGMATYAAPKTIASSLGASIPGSPVGYLAAVRFLPESAVLFTLTQSDTYIGWLWGGGMDTYLLDRGKPGLMQPFAQNTISGGAAALVIGGQDTIDVYDVSGGGSKLLSAGPSSFAHSYDHELGGGPRLRTYYMLDADGDGDDDLFESNRLAAAQSGATPQLAVRAQQGSVAFGAPAVVDVPGFYSGLVETPFVAVGKARGRLLVSDGAPGAANIRALSCPAVGPVPLVAR